jgi:hypothetical protein
MSAMLRVMVGSTSFTAFEMFAPVPATEVSITVGVLTTSIVSVTAAICSRKSTVRRSPRATSMPAWFC